jgi:hypothetical protein
VRCSAEDSLQGGLVDSGDQRWTVGSGRLRKGVAGDDGERGERVEMKRQRPPIQSSSRNDLSYLPINAFFRLMDECIWTVEYPGILCSSLVLQRCLVVV